MDKAKVIESLKAAYLILEGAEKILDLKKGEGYAAAHPEIVAAYMHIAALDYHARSFAPVADHHSAMMGDLATSLAQLAGE
jgi:hypothetical protein